MAASAKTLSSETSAAINSLRADLENKISAEAAKMVEALERVETSLLTEFRKLDGPAELRMCTHAATLRALDLEMEAISDRASELKPPH